MKKLTFTKGELHKIKIHCVG